MTDFIFMVKDSSYMFVTGPDVVKTVTHEEVTAEELGGAVTHRPGRASPTSRSRTTSRRCCMVRRFVDFLPANNREKPPVRPTDDPRRPRSSRRSTRWCPDNPNKPYDIKELILKVVDEGDFFELQPDYAKNIVVGFGRMEGSTVGHRRQPADGAGRLPRHQVVDQGGALRALLRLLQHPDRHLRRRARLPARHRAGIRRHHQARREAALRLRRGDGAEGHA